MMALRALGRPADGGRMVAVKLKWPLPFTEALVVLKVTTGSACTIVCDGATTGNEV
jgi:hypothetical protein